MPRSPQQLRDDALAIWRAGVDAVQPALLVPEYVTVEEGELWIGAEPVGLASIDRIAIVGGGKAAGAMAAALEAALGDAVLAAKRVAGLVNVPADAIAPTRAIQLHPARPPGLNEPTATAAASVRQMLDLVGCLGPRDLCVCLLSGGGSALLPAPIPGVTLADKAELTRELSARGAAIDELNAVRRSLSLVKGGGLARACRAGRLVSLILSDVPGDDLAAIASGPTVDVRETPDAALDVLVRFGCGQLDAGRRAIAAIERRGPHPCQPPPCEVTNIVIGNNATAVDGAGIAAERLGYSHAMTSASKPEGPVEDVARHLVAMMRQMRDHAGPDCLISGGEPTVTLAPASIRGRGGRNQQLCLAALAEEPDWRDAALVSGGTDGEDGPTDAAGALLDAAVVQEAVRQQVDVADALRRNDAYSIWQRTGGLIKTGATHTNVCDLRVVMVSR